MTPGIPSNKVLESALEDAVRSIFDSDERERLSVNYVRQVAEKKLGLEDGFFKTEDWKERSKEVAKNAVVSAGSSPSSHTVANLLPRQEKVETEALGS